MAIKVKLGDLLDLLTDYHANGAYKKLKENVELLDAPDFAVMIRTTNFEQNNFESQLKFITEHAYNFLKKSKVYAGDIIMNKIANAGSSYLMPELGKQVSLAMNLFLLRIDPLKANPVYVFLYLKLNEAYVKSFANGSVTKTITKEAVRNLDIELPERYIQDEVVNTYFRFTDKIEVNKKTNQTLEQMAQALFKSWFVDFDPVIDNALAAGNPIPDELQVRAELRQRVIAERTTNPKLKPLPDDIQQLFPSEFEESELGWIPKEWFSGALASLARYSTSRMDGSELTLENYISTENMLTNKQGVTKASSIPSLKSAPSFITGQVLISNIRPYFKKIWLASSNGGRSNDVLGFESLESKTEAYLMNLLSQDQFFDFMMTTSKGSKMPRGDKKAIMDWGVVVPPVKIRKFYSNLVEGFYSANSIRTKENDSLVQLRDTLLPKLISGELKINKDVA